MVVLRATRHSHWRLPAGDTSHCRQFRVVNDLTFSFFLAPKSLSLRYLPHAGIHPISPPATLCPQSSSAPTDCVVIDKAVLSKGINGEKVGNN